MMKKESTKKITAGSIFLLAIVGILYLATSEGAGKSDAKYYGVFSNADGVHAGTTVYMMGIEIGKVHTIDLKESAVTMSISVDKNIKIPIDSTLQIDTLDYFASKTISVSPGFEEDYMKSGDTFDFVQNSVDYLKLLNDYLDTKIEQKKKQQKDTAS